MSETNPVTSHIAGKTAYDLATQNSLDGLRSLRQNIVLTEGTDTPCFKIVDEAINIKLRIAEGLQQ